MRRVEIIVFVLDSGTEFRFGRLLACALRYQGGKRVHNADENMAAIVAKRLAERQCQTKCSRRLSPW